MASKKIREGQCGPCALCKKVSTRYTHPDKMDQSVYEFIYDIEKGSIGKDVCICHACYKQAARNVGNNSYHPRWRPKITIAKDHCGVEKCNQEVYRHTSITSPTQIQTILQENVSTFSITNTVTTPLCQAHYNKGLFYFTYSS